MVADMDWKHAMDWNDKIEVEPYVPLRGGNKSGGPSRRNGLIDVAGDVEFWHSPEREPFATISIDGHRENWPVRSKEFRCWLAERFFDLCGRAPGYQAMEDASRVLEMKAIRGPEHRVFVRIGEYDGAVYLDLCDAEWRAVEITMRGWRVVERSPVKFRRSRAARALPEPERGESVRLLREFLNVATEADFILAVACLFGWFRPSGPYPILVLNGEQGSAKSTGARILRDLIDPRAGGIRALPRHERDLAVAADNAWCLCFDNISGLPGWLSDALSRLSTGGGFGTRELHSDRDEVIFDAQRPIILNGIPDLVGRPDLGERAVSITLKPIRDEARRAESELWVAFQAARPAILGALLDAVSAALRNWESVTLARMPRMADFARWVAAAEEGLGWKEGTFADAYDANREAAVTVSVESDPVASTVRAFAEKQGHWTGTAGELLDLLDQGVSERMKKSKAWPATPSALGRRLRRATPGLRQLGIEIETNRETTKDRTRLITIRANTDAPCA